MSVSPQSGLIEPHDLARKHANELHANAILVVAHYIAAGNIDTIYAEQIAQTGGTTAPFPGLEDRTILHFNERTTLSGIPDAAHLYMLGSRSAIEWIIDRYYATTDKASQIVNDPNDWSHEVGNPRHILDLLARVVTVSVERMEIVDSPPLEALTRAV